MLIHVSKRAPSTVPKYLCVRFLDMFCRIASMALWQTHDCPSVREETLENIWANQSRESIKAGIITKQSAIDGALKTSSRHDAIFVLTAAP